MAIKKLTPQEQEEIRRQMQSGDAVVVDVSAPKAEATPDNALDNYGAWRGSLDSKYDIKPGDINPYAGDYSVDTGDKSSSGLHGLRGFMGGLTAGNINLPETSDIGDSGKIAESIGAAGGMAAAFGVGGNGVGRLAAPVASRLPAIMSPAIKSAIAFSGYEGLRPAETAGERMSNVGHGAALGAAMGAIPAIPIIGPAMARPVGNAIGNSALMVGLNKAQGSSWRDAVLQGVPFALAGTAIHSPMSRASAPGPKEMSPARSSGVRSPIDGVPVSEQMSRYLNNEIDFRTYIKESASVDGQTGKVSREALKEAADALKKENAQRVAGGKKKKPITKQRIYAVAESKSVSPDVSSQVSAGLPDVRLRETMDTRRTIRDVGDGELNTPIENNTQRLGEMAQLVRSKLNIDMASEARKVLEETGIKADSKQDIAMGKIVDQIANGESPAEFMAGRGKDIVAEATKGLPAEDVVKVVDGAARVREFLEEQRVLRDEINKGYLGAGFHGREGQGYLPKQEAKVPLLKNPVRRIMQETEPRQYQVRQDSGASPQNPTGGAGPRRIRSSREKQRSDSEMKYPREYRTHRVVEDYVGDSAKKLAYQPVISSTKGVVASIRDDIFRRKADAAELRKQAKEMEEIDPDIAKEMRDEADKINSPEVISGLKRTAEAVDGVMQASYNDIHYGITGKMIDKLSVSRPGMAVLRGSRLGKNIFNMAKYKVNIPFIVLRQWSSSGQGLGIEPDVTPKDMVKAIGKMWSADTAEINRETYTGDRKYQRQGSMRHEATGVSGNATVRPRTAIERVAGKLDEISDKPTNKMEEITNRYSAALGEIIADKRGLTGRDKMDFISDITSRMQSEYHKEGMAEIRRNPVANFAVPAQSFSLEVFNNLRTSKSNVQRLKLIGGMAMTNAVYQFVNSYYKADRPEQAAMMAFEMALDTAGATFPGSSLVTGRGPSKGSLYPTALIEEVLGEMPSLVKKGMDETDQDKANIYYERAASVFAKNFVPGGGQISRAIMADVMLKRGIIPQEEVAQAAALGWWTTEGGKAYLRRMTGNGEKKVVGNRQVR
jgi:hypothetical protein